MLSHWRLHRPGGIQAALAPLPWYPMLLPVTEGPGWSWDELFFRGLTILLIVVAVCLVSFGFGVRGPGGGNPLKKAEGPRLSRVGE